MCASLFFFFLCSSNAIYGRMWSRLAALASHGPQNSKQSGVLLELLSKCGFTLYS